MLGVLELERETRMEHEFQVKLEPTFRAGTGSEVGDELMLDIYGS